MLHVADYEIRAKIHDFKCSFKSIDFSPMSQEKKTHVVCMEKVEWKPFAHF